MKAPKYKYSCTICKAEYLKWLGQCNACGKWNTVEQIQETARTPTMKKSLPSKSIPINFKEITHLTPIKRNSLFVMAGEPGIGKSTLIAQMCLRMPADSKVLYCTGEEAVDSVLERINRIRIAPAIHATVQQPTYCDVQQPIYCDVQQPTYCENVVIEYEPYIERIQELVNNDDVDLLVIDSMHTLRSTAGLNISVICDMLREMAIHNNMAIILTSHITKEGIIAGPKSIEHMVDVVFYLEGERYGTIRTLRCIKNRFGATNQASMFEMTSTGLIGVNAQNRFVDERIGKMCGSVLSAINVNGQMIVVEVQSLVVKENVPRVEVSGYTSSRVRMLINVIAKLCNLTNLNFCCICVSIAKGIKTDDAAVELGICAAILSSYLNIHLPANLVFVGEISLTGNISRYNAKYINNLQQTYKVVCNGGSDIKVETLPQLLKFMNRFKKHNQMDTSGLEPETY
jgi:DNA repair protein RadA/Sms